MGRFWFVSTVPEKRKGIVVANRKVYPVCKKLQVRQQSHRFDRYELDPIQEADDDNTLTHKLLPSLTLEKEQSHLLILENETPPEIYA